MKELLNKIFGKTQVTNEGFSHFFHDSAPSEKERVIGDAVRKSTEDQKALVDRYHQVKTS